MGIHSFWIFDRHCNCIFDREWTLLSNSGSGTINSKQNDETAKLLYGMVYSLRTITQKLSHGSMKNEIRTIATGKYLVHIFAQHLAYGLYYYPISVNNLIRRFYITYMGIYMLNMSLIICCPHRLCRK